MRRMSGLAFLFLIFVTSVPAATASGGAFEDAVMRAGAEDKPLLVFSRPERCRLENRIDPCVRFLELITHPAMARRLRSLVFLQLPSNAADGSITLYDPAGNPAGTWPGAPSLGTFTRILALVETAAPHLVAANEARRNGDESASILARALAMLSLGKEAEGREFLESLHMSGEEEVHQLAVIWLKVLDSNKVDGTSPLEFLEDLGEEGVTDRVRFEAWSAAGRLHSEAGDADESLVAYRRALAIAPEKMRHAALFALHDAEARGLRHLGLGSPGSVVVGRRTVQPRSVPKDTMRVEFRLDGELVKTATRAPFIASVNFGRVPNARVLEITAYDRAGRVLSRSRTAVNQGSEDVGISFLQPSSQEISGQVPLAVDVQVPPRREIENVIIEWNGERVATFSAPPYESSLRIGEGEAGVLRAVLRLDDDSESEAVLLINSGTMTLDAEVNLVELPVYSEGGALSPSEITLREAGLPRAIDRIIPAAESPLRIALVLDTSRSMEEHLLDVQEAAIRFVETKVSSQDRVMLLTFGRSMRILWPTGDREQVERAILQMQPSGGTPLREAIVTALLQVPTTGARRALVVFSDGIDTGSSFSRDDLAEVARRSGVPIYVLLLPAAVGYETPRSGRNAVLIPSARERVQRAQGHLRKLSEQSGGRVFKLESFAALDMIWSEIAADLENQSLVIFRTEPTDKEWRPIDVSRKSGKRLRAPQGIHVAAARESGSEDN